MFGLRAFDSREPISQMLLGETQHNLRVLVLDAAASPVNFHNIVLENCTGHLGVSGSTDCAGRRHLAPASLAVSCVCNHA